MHPNAQVYLPQLASKHQEALQLLDRLGQNHIFANWTDGHLEKVQQFCDQVLLLDSKYPGGLAGYQQNAIRLLASSKAGENPFDGYTPKIPVGEKLDTLSPAFQSFEEIGIKHVGGVCFVLVAGGLGERLGYNGIKIAIPTDLITGKNFIQLYVEHILALQKRSQPPNGHLPLAIMTSGDTHEATVKLLKEHNNFGMADGQITIVKQEQVPSILDNDGHFAVNEHNPFLIDTKPHGHGDVHSLLYMEGLVAKWKQEGRQWVLFFQDTNPLVFRALPAALGVSIDKQFDSNSLTVARVPGEPVGAIMKLDHQNGTSITCNVEYNQLEPLLKSTGHPEGDKADETGFSPYPGNINVLIFNLNSYHEELTVTGGQVPEFVNPKYSNAEKTIFTKPTRLECMMQDFTRLMASRKVGFTQLDRWISFSSLKNNVEEAAKKAKAGQSPASASSCEADIYETNAKILQIAGAEVETGATETYLGISTVLGPKIHLAPSFGCTLSEIKSKVNGLKISGRSVLVLEGDVHIQNVKLDGSLVVSSEGTQSKEVKDLEIQNQSWVFEPLADANAAPEYLKIRGYQLQKIETYELS
eukprot:TRINITY_DN9883_c0_g1_i1.p1 TRINITY_DN9883_c0_g1~~TRINITY_DN9883_c0_g1_i1.p1  ORF type:complete len:584 (-),score=131.60 TRINITY_DN9883_c0_g1_i1:115-1866(-)